MTDKENKIKLQFCKFYFPKLNNQNKHGCNVIELNSEVLKSHHFWGSLISTFQFDVHVLLLFFRKLKERITQLDSENTALTRAHIERYVQCTYTCMHPLQTNCQVHCTL